LTFGIGFVVEGGKARPPTEGTEMVFFCWVGAFEVNNPLLDTLGRRTAGRRGGGILFESGEGDLCREAWAFEVDASLDIMVGLGWLDPEERWILFGRGNGGGESSSSMSPDSDAGGEGSERLMVGPGASVLELAGPLAVFVPITGASQLRR
jgi:hypothetical protein